VEHNIDAFDCSLNSRRIPQVALDLLDALNYEEVVRSPGERTNAITAGNELFDNMAAKKTTAAGDESEHLYYPISSSLVA
jgi:hypothetical protein